MDPALRILNLEDDPRDTELVRALLRKDGLRAEIDRVDTLAAFQDALGRDAYAVILSDYALPGVDAVEALRLARARRPEVPFLFLSGALGEETAIELLKRGASDYVLKSRIERLAPAVRRARQEAEEQARRREAEAALRESEARYRLLFQHMLDGIAYCQMLFDAEGHPDDFIYLAVNDAFGKMTGLAEVVGKRVTEVIPRIKEMTPELFEAYGRVASTGTPERFEIDFTPLGLYLSVAVYSPAQGDFIAVFHDLTDHKRAEQALSENERQLAADLTAMTRLQQLGTLFVQEGNLEPVLGAIVEAAIALSGADFGNIQLLDAESSELQIVAQRGFPQWWVDCWNRVSTGQGVCGTALERGERVIVEDVEHSPIFVGTPALDVQRRAGVRAVQSTPLVSRSGKPIGMFSTHYKRPHRPDERALGLLDLLARQAADIIERAQAEAALAAAHAHLRTIMETAQVAILVAHDAQCRRVTGNPMAHALLGAPADGNLSSTPVDTERAIPWRVLSKGHELAGDEMPIQQAARTGAVVSNLELEIVRENGERTAILCAAAPLRDAAGIITGAVGTVLDITARKQAEARLAADLAALTRMHALSARPSDANRIPALLQDIMDAAVAIMGAERGTLQLREGDSLRIVAHHGHRQPFLDFFAAAEDTASVCGAACEQGARVVVPDVEESALFAGTLSLAVLRAAGVRAIQSTPLQTRAGTLLGILTTQWGTSHTPDEHDLWRLDLLVRQAADLIEAARAEAALRQANATLEQRVKERTAELSQALQKVSFQAEELRSLSSELTLVEQRERSHLAELIHDGLQQLLVAAKFRLDQAGRATDPRIRQACEDAVRLINDAIADARSLTAELSPPILRTGGLLAGLEWLVRWSQEKHHLTVKIAAPPAALPPLPEDLTVLLFQSVRELLFNIVKYAGVAEALVTVARTADGLTLTVADTGVGFDPHSLRGEGGTGGGFGLARVRHRLELLGGCMRIDSAPGQGSRVTLAILLPKGEPPAVASLRSHSHAAIPAVLSGAPDQSRRIRVLLADDHQVVRQALAQMIGAEADIEVVGEAGTGSAAVALVHQLAPDVVLMDINMPEMNGIDATQAIHAAFPAIRVIGLSMYDQADQQTAMQEAGAVAYLSKSTPGEALLAAIRGHGLVTGTRAPIGPAPGDATPTRRRTTRRE